MAELELGKQVFGVRPLSREELPAVIAEPARLAGIDVDDGLVARLVNESKDGEALPLLAYTLAQLAEGVKRGGRLLMTRYEQLGGWRVQGTMTRQANAALFEAVQVRGRVQAAILEEFLQLVTVDEEGRPTRRRNAMGNASAYCTS